MNSVNSMYVETERVHATHTGPVFIAFPLFTAFTLFTGVGRVKIPRKASPVILDHSNFTIREFCRILPKTLKVLESE